MNKKDLTIHSVVRNEPFIYYSIKSIYDYCNTILLYDTGSDDTHTLEDIKKLIEEDKDNKIIFIEDKIEFDEYKWTVHTINKVKKEGIGRRGVAQVRQKQIDDTKTKYFMIVDGDEVHYKETMEQIMKYNMPKEILMAQLPLTWFYDLNNTFECYSPTGRIWRTDRCEMRKSSPGHAHIDKVTKIAFTPKGKNVQQLLDLKPYAHFETLLKPYRRKATILKDEIKSFKGKLPEVMLQNDYYIKRFLNGVGNRNEI